MWCGRICQNSTINTTRAPSVRSARFCINNLGVAIMDCESILIEVMYIYLWWSNETFWFVIATYRYAWCVVISDRRPLPWLKRPN